jgi:hypothetical protein
VPATQDVGIASDSVVNRGAIQCIAAAGKLEIVSPTSGGSINVANNGTIWSSGATSIIGFNGGASGAVTVTGTGAIASGQAINLGNLNPTTL